MFPEQPWISVESYIAPYLLASNSREITDNRRDKTNRLQTDFGAGT